MTLLSIRYERHAQRRDTEANWAAGNPVLAAGEIGAVTDSGLPWPYKIGDGSTAWLSLPYSGDLFAAASGADTITATFDPKPVLYDGMEVRLRAAGANTGAVTFNPNSLGASAVTKHGGTALVAGDIAAAGHELVLRYRSSVPRWELLNPAIPSLTPYALLAGGTFTGDISVPDEGYDATNWNGSLEVPTKNALRDKIETITAGGGAMTLVGTSTVTGSAATTLAISGLDLTTDGHYYVVFALENATASGANLSIYCNADTTATNYYRQLLTANNTTISGARANDAISSGMTASESCTGWFNMTFDRKGKPRAIGATNRDGPTALILQQFGHVWNSVTNPTGITISSSVANSLAVGSYIKVFKVN